MNTNFKKGDLVIHLEREIVGRIEGFHPNNEQVAIVNIGEPWKPRWHIEDLDHFKEEKYD